MSSEVVSDVFWTHPDSVKLLNAFHIVLLMDNIYKTNKYRLPLLEIVGVISTGLILSVAFVVLSNEREYNFVWALQKLKGLLLMVDHHEVIVCDRDLALMNAISIVFPEFHNLLCRFHINKNVKARCKMLVNTTKARDVIMEAWENIIDSTNVRLFEDCVKHFEPVCEPWSLFVEYVKKTWLILHKEKFVKVWIDNFMHLGNLTCKMFCCLILV